MDRDFILKRHDELKALRLPEEKIWRRIAALLSPEDDQFSTTRDRADYSNIFDSAPLYAHDDFVSGLFSQATNPANRWFTLSHEDPDLAAWKPVKDWLYASTAIIDRTFRPGVSPFYAEVPSWFGDIGAFGNGGLVSEEEPGQARIMDRAIPLYQLFIDRDRFGELDTVHREFRLARRLALKQFGAVQGLDDKPGEITLIHAVFPNPAHNPKKIDSKSWLSVYVSPDVKALWRTGGYYEMPYHIPGWSRGVGGPWHRGPGHRALADMSTLQEMERVHLVAAQFAAEPPLLLHAESDLTAADIEPNALLYGSISEQGKELARVLNRSQNVQLSLQQSEARRKAIREAFYVSLMQVVNRPQMTATEILGYREENLRMMGPSLARIQHGGLSPLIARRFGILDRAGAFPPPPPELQGKPVSIEYVSPLALAQRAGEGRATMQTVNAAMQMAQARPDVLDNVNFDKAFEVVHGAFGAPPSVLRDPTLVQEDRQARAGAQQRQAELADAGAQVDIAAKAGHAAQAASLIAGRGPQ